MINGLIRSLRLGTPAGEIVAAAAVSERPNTAELLQAWLKRHPNAAGDEILDAMEVTLDLEIAGSASVATDGSTAIDLSSTVRQNILQIIGRKGALQQLAAKTALTLTERSFYDLLKGQPVDLEDVDRFKLTALEMAVEWAQFAGVDKLPEQAALQAERRRRDFVEMIGGDDLQRFVGREGFLATLNHLWQLDPDTREAVLVEGPGGMGKSFAIARFITSLIDNGDPTMRPDAVFVLDYERLDLQTARTARILAEIGQQLARWWVPGFVPDQDPYATDVVDGLESISESARSSEARRSLPEIAQAMLAALVPTAGSMPRLLVFVDTFEEVDSFDDSAMLSVHDACALLRKAGADVMEIYAGRHFRTPARLAIRQSPIELKLGRMKQGEAVQLLRREAKALDIVLDKQAADAAQRQLKGWPLDIRLAVALMAQQADSFDAQRWLAELESSSMRRQATLYDRVLKRLQDDELRKLAKPGLLLRRLTAALIVQVLAEPCGLELDETGAQRLLKRAKDLGQLFVADPTDPGVVWHRHDVRSLMFADLRSEIDPSVAIAIHRAAVAFYERQSGPENRAEELYHRLQLGEPAKLLEQRWDEMAGQRLKRSLAELPPSSQDWLRLRLGGARVVIEGERTARKGSPRTRMRLQELRLAAQKRLQGGDWTIADILQSSGLPESAITPLGDVYVQSLVQQGRLHEAVQEALRLRASSQPLPRGVRSSVFASAAGVLEAMQRWADAFDFWAAAAKVGRGLPAAERLGYQVGKMRTRRHQSIASGRSAMLRQATRLVEAIGAPLRNRRVLARETVAELLEVLTRKRTGPAVDILLETFSGLCNHDEVFIHASIDPRRRAIIAQQLGFSESVAQRELNAVAERMAFSGGPIVEKLLAIVREEVDWSIRRTIKD